MQQHPLPPKWADRFLEWFCKEELLEILKGDVHELFEQRVQEQGVRKARWRFVFDVLDLFRPFAWRHFWQQTPNTVMLKHHFRASFRNIWRHRGPSLINLIGLCLGMLCAICLFLKVRYEFRFNSQFPNGDRIYRIVSEVTEYGNLTYHAGTFYPIAEAMRVDFPDIEAATLIDGNFRGSGINIKQPNGEVKQFKVQELAMVDAEFFKVFEQEWVVGNPTTALRDPHTAVITESLAMRLFGTKDVMGRRLGLENEFEAVVTGIIQDPPPNADIGFHLYLAQEPAIPKRWGLYGWESSSGSIQCFVKLSRGQDPKGIEEQFSAFYNKYRGENPDEICVLSLQTLKDLHFDTRHYVYDVATVSRSSVWTMALLGMLLLLMACVNFVNFNTALISKRAKEIGIRKILGSLRRDIVLYFLSETAIIAFLALIFAMLFCFLLLPPIEALLGMELVQPLWVEGEFWGAVLLIWAAVVFLAGLYPAQLLARLDPSLAIRRKISNRYGRGLNLRKGLIIFQFAVTQILVICVIVAGRQMQLFNESPIGLNKDAILEMSLPMANTEEQRLSLREELSRIPAVQSVSFSNTGSASTDAWFSGYEYTPINDQIPQVKGKTQVKATDETFLGVYGISLLAGENLLVQQESRQVLVNETLAKELGVRNFEELLGASLTVWNKPYQIVGVVQDFNTQSLKQPMWPVAIISLPSNHLCGIKLTPQNLSESIPAIRKVYNSFFPNHLFDFHFLDERIASFYAAERRSMKLFRLAAGIAIAIGCLGLFGLISFLTARRFKEIGIRKVMGAEVQDIIRLFFKEFAWLVILGFMIGAPIAIYLMTSWLETFANHIELDWEIFLITLLFSFLLVAMTVGYQVYRAASADPLESIHVE